MAKVISFVNSKGGAGKTTLASLLATFLDKQGSRTLLIDTDPEGSLSQWHARREDKGKMECMSLPLNRLSARVKHEVSAGEWDYLIVDTPGRLDEIRPALDADIVIIPVQSGGHDLVRFNRAFAVCKQSGARVIVVPNRVKTGTNAGKTIGPTLELMTAGAATVSPVTIHDRAGHGSNSMEGLTILDVDGLASIGAKEAVQLSEYIVGALSNGQQ